MSIEAIEFFEEQGFIEELTTDKKYYVQELIDYCKKFNKAVVSIREIIETDGEELTDGECLDLIMQKIERL
tara:strand:- start:20 stop:232 length:213 start_codon:yes stop_codon:yes gene_type:complete